MTETGALGQPPARDCTGLTAHWCPIHGTCICVAATMIIGRLVDPLSDPTCPLHGVSTTHPLIPYKTCGCDSQAFHRGDCQIVAARTEADRD